MSTPNGILLTTSVGSFPKPDYLAKGRVLYGKKQITRDDLRELERRATREVIALQEALGIDILVDGEMERDDMATFFAERLDGFEISGWVRSYGNRYYRKPIVVGEVRRPRPMTLELFEFAQSLTDKPVKGMLTGPYTMTDWSFNEHYATRRDLMMAMAEVIREEALDLQRAGARYIQIDEPALSTRPDELEDAIAAVKIVTDGLTAKTVSHMCYGDFKTIYPGLLRLPVDQLDLEAANNDYQLLRVIRAHPFNKEIALGVVDSHDHRIESKEEVKQGIYKALEFFTPQQLHIDPDCGLKTRTWEEAKNKLAVIIEAVREVRAEIKSGKVQALAPRA
jgi:5-methyltetrahydropteroyltriglutamate--homocysteine methyltransferase